MPAVSKAQRRAMAVAKYHPGKLYARNRGLLRLKKEGKLNEYITTREKHLPQKRARERKTRKRRR